MQLHAEPSPALRPPQFRLATLFTVTALFSALFAVMALVGATWAIAIAFFLTLVAGHVLGNSLGTRLSNEAPGRADSPPAPLLAQPAPREHQLAANAAFQCGSLGLGTRLAAALAAVAGAAIGGSAFASAYWQHIDAAGVALVTCSFAVLGGLAGFMLSSFVTVLHRALSDGQPEPR